MVHPSLSSTAIRPKPISSPPTRGRRYSRRWTTCGSRRSSASVRDRRKSRFRLTTYRLTFLRDAKKEWEKLASPLRKQFEKKLRERLTRPRVPADRLQDRKSTRLNSSH